VDVWRDGHVLMGLIGTGLHGKRTGDRFLADMNAGKLAGRAVLKIAA
jgi:hypothetical protein